MTTDKPVMLENPDLTALKEQVQAYVNFVDSEEYHEDNDYDHYIFEQAMMTFFGPKYFEWQNKKTS